MRHVHLIAATALLALGCSRGVKTEAAEQPTIKTGFVSVDDTKLYYEEMGSGKPLILIHGGLLDRRMWDEQFAEFSEHFRVIRYDARGHGKSGSVTETFSHHEDLCHLMEALEIDEAILLGLSMGGYISIDFALAYPDKVTSLVLVSPGLTGYEFKGEFLEQNNREIVAAIGDGDFDRLVEHFQRSWTDGPYRTPDQVDQRVRESVRVMALETARNYRFENLERRLSPPAINRLSEIKTPTLAVVGTLDMPGIREIVDMIGRDIDGVEVVEIEGAAHMVNMEKPKGFNRAVLRFLSKAE
jgi:3-oxoadipate enol-lactonase